VVPIRPAGVGAVPSDEVALLVLGDLAGDEDQPGSGPDGHMGAGRGGGQIPGVDAFERH
jgi:hypothetical protein